MGFNRWLGKSQAWRGLHADGRRLAKVFERRKVPAAVAAYLRQAEVPGLHLGAGKCPIDGWFNTDAVPRAPGVHLLDILREFPIPDASFRYVFAEHLIEHVKWQEGLRVLRECHRVLAPGGTVRLATPDLAKMTALHQGLADDPRAAETARYACERWVNGVQHDQPTFYLNNSFYSFGHCFLYNESVLRHSLTDAGFENVRRLSMGESDDPHLRDIEQHGIAQNKVDLVQWETMVLEADRP